MGTCCGNNACGAPAPTDSRVRVLLWIALCINAVMFAVEMITGIVGGSVSLQADALDFLSDAANYGISLLVVGRALRTRATAALIKGASMAAFGVWVFGQTVYQAALGTVPAAEVMGGVGFVALIANLSVAAMLFTLRHGDSNLKSAWICSRNDAIGNGAVLLAAGGVFATTSRWPDILVAAIIATLALSGALHIIRQAWAEWKTAPHTLIPPP